MRNSLPVCLQCLPNYLSCNPKAKRPDCSCRSERGCARKGMRPAPAAVPARRASRMPAVGPAVVPALPRRSSRGCRRIPHLQPRSQPPAALPLLAARRCSPAPPAALGALWRLRCSQFTPSAPRRPRAALRALKWDPQASGRTDCRTARRTGGWIDRKTGGWADAERVDGQTDGQTGG